MLTRAQLGWVVAGLLAVVVAVLIWELYTRPSEPPPTPAPATFDSSNVDKATMVPLSDVRKYVSRLSFDTVLGAADEQLVDFKNWLIGTGDTARIEPERGSYRISKDDLARGRIIARIRVRRGAAIDHRISVQPRAVGDTIDYSSEFGPWWTYWWVDKKGGKWRSVYIADREERSNRPALDIYPIDHRPGHRWRQAIARWVIGSVRPWGTCSNSCCQ